MHYCDMNIVALTSHPCSRPLPPPMLDVPPLTHINVHDPGLTQHGICHHSPTSMSMTLASPNTGCATTTHPHQCARPWPHPTRDVPLTNIDAHIPVRSDHSHAARLHHHGAELIVDDGRPRQPVPCSQIAQPEARRVCAARCIKKGVLDVPRLGQGALGSWRHLGWRCMGQGPGPAL